MTGAAATGGLPKLLHVVLSLEMGGAERLVYDMVRAPRFASARPTVCCLQGLGELGEQLRAEGYRVLVGKRRPGLDLALLSWLRQVIRAEGAEVVHAHQYTPLFYAVPAALWAGAGRVVYTEHGRLFPDRRRWKRYLCNPFLAAGVDALVAISASTARAMAAVDNFPAGRIGVIHNGIDCSRLQPPLDREAKRRELGIPEGARVIGTAARLNGIKNLGMMLRVLRLALDQVPDCYLVIAGEGAEGLALRAQARELGVAERVGFVGLRFDLPEVYPLFEVFLLSSFSEGISVTLLEAMASGVPPVVTAVGGNPEVVREGDTGFLVPVDDDRLMARRVVDLLRQGELAARIGDAAQRKVRRDFSFQGMMDAYCSLYAGEPSPAGAQAGVTHA